jgi:hypothetical protein
MRKTDRLRSIVGRLVIWLALRMVNRAFRNMVRTKLMGPDSPVDTDEQVVVVLSRENGAQPYKRRVIQ